MPRKIVGEYEIVRHGIMSSDYFQGCGAGSEFDDCYTGCGDNPADALADAKDNASSTWDTSIIDDKLPSTPSVSVKQKEEYDSIDELALEAWKEEQIEAGKTERADDWDGTDDELEKTFSVDDFEPPDHDNDRGGYNDSYYYLSIRVKEVEAEDV